MGKFTTRWAQPIVILLMSLSVIGLSKAEENSNSGSLQLSGLETAASTDPEQGMPERGRFLMIYTYQGQSIEPDISVTLNGETIASLNQLSSVNWTTLADLETDKGDQAVLDAHFMDDGGTIALHNSFGSLTQGYWANQFNINFYLRDEDGNFVEHLGTMSIAFYLFPPFEGFVIEADPGSIAPGEESSVHFESVELPDEPVIVPSNTAVDFRLSPNGWRLGGYALPMLDAENLSAIINMPYAFMANTPIYYRADPDSTLLEGTSEDVQLGVFSHFNTSITGQTGVEVSVEEDEITFRIEFPGSSQVWPVLRDQTASQKNQTNFIIEVLNNGEPIPDFPISVEVAEVLYSGGHDHNGTDNTNEGKNEKPIGNIVVSSEITNEFGFINGTYFTKSKFGGEDWIIISSSEVSKTDSTKITIQVPGLDSLKSSPYYEKIGAPDNHKGTNDPCRDSWTLSSQHYSNHWGTPVLNNTIKIIAAEFHSLYPGSKLRINDMSLENGGVFDLTNKWITPHKSHRIGLNTDIGFAGIAPDGSCIPRLNLRDLRKIIEDRTGFQPYVESNHYHLYK